MSVTGRTASRRADSPRADAPSPPGPDRPTPTFPAPAIHRIHAAALRDALGHTARADRDHTPHAGAGHHRDQQRSNPRHEIGRRQQRRPGRLACPRIPRQEATGILSVQRRSERCRVPPSTSNSSGQILVGMTLLTSRRTRPLLRGRRLLHRPVAARGARGHHARARRPRAMGIGALPRARARARACCARARARRDDPRRRLGRAGRHQRRPRLAPPGRATSSAPRRCASSIAARCGSRRATTRREPDPTCTPFELVRCHTFITESTFGLPIYRWPPDGEVFDEIRAWWRANRDARPRVAAVRATRSARRSGCSPDSPTRTSGPSTRTARSSD